MELELEIGIINHETAYKLIGSHVLIDLSGWNKEVVEIVGINIISTNETTISVSDSTKTLDYEIVVKHADGTVSVIDKSECMEFYTPEHAKIDLFTWKQLVLENVLKYKTNALGLYYCFDNLTDICVKLVDFIVNDIDVIDEFEKNNIIKAMKRYPEIPKNIYTKDGLDNFFDENIFRFNEGRGFIKLMPIEIYDFRK